jgi:acetamidase/formamidase
MTPEIVRASTDPDWPRAIADLEGTTLETALTLRRFASQMHAHQTGGLTASDLYLTEAVYQKTRRMLRRAVRSAAVLLRRRHSRWGAASLLCSVAVDVLERDSIERSVVVAIQVDVTRWTLEQYDGGRVISM